MTIEFKQGDKHPDDKKVIKTMGYPYARDQILKTNDAELKNDMNLIYNRLKKHFDKNSRKI